MEDFRRPELSLTKKGRRCGGGAPHPNYPDWRELGMQWGVRHRDSDYGAQAAGLLLALCHWRACQQQALRNPRSILEREW